MTWTWTVGVALSLALAVSGSDPKAQPLPEAGVVNELSLDLSVKLDSYSAIIHPIDVKFVASEGNAKGVKWTVESKDVQQILMEMQALVDVEHSISADDLQKLMKAADLDNDGVLSLHDLAKHITQQGLDTTSISNRFSQDKDKMINLLYDFGPIHAGEYVRLYTFCHKNFYRQMVDHMVAVGEGRFYERVPYADLATLIKGSDVLSVDNKDYSTARIKGCMSKFLEKCKAGGCKIKRGFFRTVADLIKAPFMSSFSSSVAIFRINRSGQNA